jgi:hypothetical protein
MSKEIEKIEEKVEETKKELENLKIEEKITEYLEIARIKEVKILLNTGVVGSAIEFTPKIKGKVVAFIFKTTASVNVNISLENYSTIALFETGNAYITGEKYIPIGLNPINNKYEQMNFANTNYYINDKLRVEVMGPYNTETEVRILYI